MLRPTKSLMSHLTFYDRNIKFSVNQYSLNGGTKVPPYDTKTRLSSFSTAKHTSHMNCVPPATECQVNYFIKKAIDFISKNYSRLRRITVLRASYTIN